VTDIDIDAAHEFCMAAVGRQAWGTKLGVGSFLTVEFGAAIPRRDAGKREHGEYHLWVYCSAWHIQSADRVLASSEDPRESLEKDVRALDGLTLIAVRIEYPSLSTTFEFEGSVSLQTFSIFSRDYEHWMLYMPDTTVLTAGPASALTTSVAATGNGDPK
jgi:hypothetical protein